MNPPTAPRPIRAARPVTRARSIVARVLSGSLVLGTLLSGATLHGGEVAIRGDLFVGVWSPFGTLWRTESSVCVWEQGGRGVFLVTVSGRSDAEHFRLANTAGDTVRYDVSWYRNNGRGQSEQLLPGQPSRTGTRASSRPDCGGGTNARLAVEIDRLEIDRAPSGIYSDTLTMTLSSL